MPAVSPREGTSAEESHRDSILTQIKWKPVADRTSTDDPTAVSAFPEVGDENQEDRCHAADQDKHQEEPQDDKDKDKGREDHNNQLLEASTDRKG